MSLNTAKYVAALRGLTGIFKNRVMAAKPFYPKIATIKPSIGADENYGILGNMPTIREWLGDRIAKELNAAQYLIANKKWESTLKVNRFDIDDDRVGMYSEIFSELGDEAALHPDELVFNALKNGETNACFDGQYFFDTDHSWGDSGTQSNNITYDAVDTANVTVSEFKKSYVAARKAMIGFLRENGKPFIRPTVQGVTGLLMVVPPALEQVANEAVRSIIISQSTNIVLDAPEIVTSAFLTDGTKWDLYKTDTPLKPFIFQARQPLRMQVKNVTDIQEQDILAMVEARYNVAYGGWWNAVRTTFN